MKKDFYFRQLLSGIAWKLYCFSENLNNVDMTRNGEDYFISHLISSQSRKFCFFDVGANLGGYTQRILNKFPDAEGHLFEPLPNCVLHLHDRFKGKVNIIINQMGLSNSSEEETIFFDNSSSALASFYKRDLDHYGIQLNNSLIVSTTTLDDYIRVKNIQHINLLKIDVEGHELKVLQGMRDFLSPSFVDIIQFEYGGTSFDSNTLLYCMYNQLEKTGFVVCKLMPKGLWIRRYTPIMENFQYSNYVAVSRDFLHSF